MLAGKKVFIYSLPGQGQIGDFLPPSALVDWRSALVDW